jgi:hypothetical protein
LGEPAAKIKARSLAGGPGLGYSAVMTLRRTALVAIPVLGLAAWAVHTYSLAAQTLAFVHAGWLAAFIDSVNLRLFCL